MLKDIRAAFGSSKISAENFGKMRKTKYRKQNTENEIQKTKYRRNYYETLYSIFFITGYIGISFNEWLPGSICGRKHDGGYF